MNAGYVVMMVSVMMFGLGRKAKGKNNEKGCGDANHRKSPVAHKKMPPAFEGEGLEVLGGR